MKIGHQISCQNLGKHTHGDRRGHVMNEQFENGQKRDGDFSHHLPNVLKNERTLVCPEVVFYEVARIGFSTSQSDL